MLENIVSQHLVEAGLPAYIVGRQVVIGFADRKESNPGPMLVTTVVGCETCSAPDSLLVESIRLDLSSKSFGELDKIHLWWRDGSWKVCGDTLHSKKMETHPIILEVLYRA